MIGLKRLAVLVGAAAAAGVLFIVLRPDGDGDAAERTRPATTATTRTSGRRPPTPPRSRATKPVVVRIDVRGGRPLGGIRRATVEEGRRVVLVVTSDTPQEVHVHGYDVTRGTARGRPARLRFRATLTGRFEVELEGPHTQIGELTVLP